MNHLVSARFQFLSAMATIAIVLESLIWFGSLLSIEEVEGLSLRVNSLMDMCHPILTLVNLKN